MTKPLHSMAGYLRSLQISRYQLFVFVEGIDADPFFFGEVCRVACQGRAIHYRVRPAKELPQAAGGKLALIAFYRLAKSRGKLRFTLGGKTTVLMFYLDKDVDDLMHRLCRSRHICYTQYYDVQNHIFRHADLIRGIASAASVDPVELEEIPQFDTNWCESAARRWKDWIVLCLIGVRHGVPGPNYRVLSQVNSPLNGPVDSARYQAMKTQFAGHLGLNPIEIDRKIKLTAERVDKCLSGGTFDYVFKGKWYASILEADLRVAFAGRAVQFDRFANRVPAALAATLNFSEPWAKRFVGPLERLLEEAF